MPNAISKFGKEQPAHLHAKFEAPQMTGPKSVAAGRQPSSENCAGRAPAARVNARWALKSRPPARMGGSMRCIVQMTVPASRIRVRCRANGATNGGERED